MKAVILAAGRGTRLTPLTNTMPKCMLPLAGKPILEHIIHALVDSGITDLIVVVGYKSKDIIDYFNKASYKGVKLRYVTQKNKLGTAHALGMVRLDDDFIVLNGDTLISNKTIEEVLKSYKSGVYIALKTVKNPKNYGAVLLKGDRVVKLVEKPEKKISPLINAGIYIFSPEIFNAIKDTKKSERGEYELTSSINLLLQKGIPVKGIKITELWEDVSTPWSYLNSNHAAIDLMKTSNKGEVEGHVKIKGKLYLGINSIIRSGCYVEGPVYIDDGCVVGPNAYIRPYTTIGRGCRVGNAVEIKNSLIMDNTKIPHLSYVGDSIIGRNCNLGAGTKVGNVRLDQGIIKMRINQNLMDTGMQKLGCVVGDNVKTGLNVMINSGRKISQDASIGPGVIVYKDIKSKSTILKKQELETR